MKKILGILVLSGLMSTGIAQATHEELHKEKLEQRHEVRAMRVSYLTNYMDLSPEESQQFWALNNQFEKEKRGLKEEVRKLRQELRQKGIESAGDAEIVAMLNAELDARVEQIALERNYQKRYLEVISAQKLAKYYQGEERFKKHLIHKMKNEERKGPPEKSFSK